MFSPHGGSIEETIFIIILLKIRWWQIMVCCRAKEEAKRQQAEAESQARKRIELEKAQEEAKREAYRKQVEASLPPEPTLSEGDTITKIRFRLPKGENLERNFQVTTPLKVKKYSLFYQFCHLFSVFRCC